jgi:hypothetical protein
MCVQDIDILALVASPITITCSRNLAADSSLPIAKLRSSATKPHEGWHHLSLDDALNRSVQPQRKTAGDFCENW